MSARRKRVISTEEIQFNHKPAKMLLTEKRRESAKMAKPPSIIGVCSYCVLDRPVFERCQTLLHPELTTWWSFLLADGAQHKKPHSPTHHPFEREISPHLRSLFKTTTSLSFEGCHMTSLRYSPRISVSFLGVSLLFWIISMLHIQW